MIALALAAVLVAAPAHESEKKPAGKAKHGPVAIPIDVGLGPVFMFANPTTQRGQIGFTGLELSLAAVIDKELIDANKDKIPAGMRGAARGVNEVRLRPWFLALIPERLVISPQVASIGANTGMYGAVWRPFGLGITFLESPVHVSANAGVDVAYIFIHSTTLGAPPGTFQSDVATLNPRQYFTHFLRPGLNVNLTAEVPLSESLLLSAGWSSDLFIPQPFGGAPWEFSPVENSLWHLGGPFLQVHVRIPYQVNL